MKGGRKNYDTFSSQLQLGPTFGKASPGTSPSWRSREHQKLNGKHKEHRQSLVSVGRETWNTWNKGNVSVSATRRCVGHGKFFPTKGRYRTTVQTCSFPSTLVVLVELSGHHLRSDLIITTAVWGLLGD